MAEKHQPVSIGKRVAMAAGLAALFVAIVGAIYVMRTGSGNDGQLAACSASPQRVAALDGLNTGQLAAFQLAQDPQFIGDLTFKDETGAPAGLKDHAGSTVLLNLWATWCAPCREEMPELDELQHLFGGGDFVVLPVSIDLGDDVKPKRFYEETGLKHLPFRHDGTIGVFNELKKRGLAFGMPTTLLVDGDGCVLGNLSGPAAWASQDAQALVRAALQR